MRLGPAKLFITPIGSKSLYEKPIVCYVKCLTFVRERNVRSLLFFQKYKKGGTWTTPKGFVLLHSYIQAITTVVYLLFQYSSKVKLCLCVSFVTDCFIPLSAAWK